MAVRAVALTFSVTPHPRITASFDLARARGIVPRNAYIYGAPVRSDTHFSPQTKASGSLSLASFPPPKQLSPVSQVIVLSVCLAILDHLPT